MVLAILIDFQLFYFLSRIIHEFKCVRHVFWNNFYQVRSLSKDWKAKQFKSLWEQITVFQDYDILKDLFLSLKVYVEIKFYLLTYVINKNIPRINLKQTIQKITHYFIWTTHLDFFTYSSIPHRPLAHIDFYFTQTQSI